MEMRFLSKFSLLVLSGFLIVACGSREGNENTAAGADTVETVDESLVHDGHNARNSLDYKGTYKGTIPCADCEGIKTSVQLMDGDTFVMKTVYVGKGDGKEFEEKGTVNWDSAGQVIALNNAEGTVCKYFVGENTLTQLNMEGEKITGPLADKYVLRKE